jgi:hypothetical protein
MNTTLALSLSSLLPKEDLAERILDAFPSGSYALSALLRLMDIVESTEVPTAAVECRVQPRLLVNPEFVAKHAQTPEKLLMLVMHELHHVLLGHTTLFPRVIKIQNFVFDAVINGLVCRMFPAKDHTAFFSDYYDAESFPQCLLRPPPGWPGDAVTAGGIAALPDPQRRLVGEVHAALYSPAGATYREVFDALPKLLAEQAIEGIPLLGGHEAHGESGVESGTQLESRSPVLFDIVRGIVEQWPQPPDPIRGRSLADVLNPTSIEARRPPSSRNVLRGLIRKVAGFSGAGAIRRLRTEQLEAPTPIPGLGRRSMVLRALGQEPLLHTGQVAWRRTVPSGERVHVYLDVSGSMDAVKGPLYGAVLDCEVLVHPVVHLFSTRVADISLAELRRGVCKSTGGTDIACVAEHMTANRVRRALLVTDGWVGKPRGRHQGTLAAAKLAVAFLGTNLNQADLKDVANYTATLSIGA